MAKNKHHILTIVEGTAFTLCGIRERDGIIYNSGKDVTCKKCLKKKLKKNNKMLLMVKNNITLIGTKETIDFVINFNE